MRKKENKKDGKKTVGCPVFFPLEYSTLAVLKIEHR
jgi:hypothetical protein